jgi:hypothetical protein
MNKYIAAAQAIAQGKPPHPDDRAGGAKGAMTFV